MPDTRKNQARRVIVANWKDRAENPFEVFSNLLLFCKSYPSYSYNTLNNYLSKEKIPFEDAVVRVERKPLLTRPLPAPSDDPFRMVRVVRTTNLHSIDEKQEDLAYWLTKTPEERIAAVTFLVSQSLKHGQRMDKTFVIQRKLGEDAFK